MRHIQFRYKFDPSITKTNQDITCSRQGKHKLTQYQFHSHHRQTGMAMLLVLIATAIATVLGLSFLNAQVTSTSMAENVLRRAQAKAIAESGLTTSVAYIRSNPNWRINRTHGTWISSHAFAGGSFTVIGEDGQDTNGDGIPDGDGNLADDHSDPVTLTSIGTFEGTSCTVNAIVTPKEIKKRLLLVVPDPTMLSAEDEARKSQFEDWNYVVSIIGEADSQAAYDAAVADADVVYIPEDVYSFTVETKLITTSIGVVWEEGRLSDYFKMTNFDGGYYSGSTQINIVNNAHFITQPLTTGYVSIVNNSLAPLRFIDGFLAPGAIILAMRSGSSVPVMAALDAGALNASSTPSPGRRVVLPWAGDDFAWSMLNPTGLTIVQRALEWASQLTLSGQIAHWNFDQISGSTVIDTIGGHDGTLINGTTPDQPGAFFGSKAVEFDGINDHVAVPHHNAFLLDQGTIALWVKSSNPMLPLQGLVTKDAQLKGTGGHFEIRIKDGKISARLQSTTTSHSIDSNEILSANTWYHVAFTFGPTGMKLYVNGSFKKQSAYTGGLGTTSGGIGNYEPIAFGVRTANSLDLSLSGWAQPFPGRLDDIYFFNRALNVDEIQRLMSVARPDAVMNYKVRWDAQP